jgi:serine/threonine protein kinase
MRTTAIGRPTSLPKPNRPFWFAPASCEVVRVIGRGGMSTVYEGWSFHTYQRVALKVSIPQATPTQLQRFANEARIGQKLTHRAIPRAYAYGRFEGGLWMTMEMVDGRSLSSAIDSNSLGLGERFRILLEISAALEHVHAHGIVHRDIKPSNIILSDEGPKLVDFGIAKVPALSLTHPRFVVGTPDYLAPEQIVGTDIDHRVDVFQLGLLAFCLFATRSPWAGNNLVEVSWATCFEKPARLSQWVRPSLPLTPEAALELEGVVDRCLARNRDHRFDSVREFGEEIYRIATMRGVVGSLGVHSAR